MSENDLISRAALLEALSKCQMADEFADHGLNWEDLTLETIRAVKVQGAGIKRIINIVPAVDAELVRHGKWIKGDYACGDNEWKCSVCGGTEWTGSADWMKFCMYCGARMDEEVSGDGQAQD